MGELVTLDFPELSLEESAHTKALFETRPQEYVQRRGIGIWDYRMLDKRPISDNVYYKILKGSGGHRALCRATKNDRLLEVDHIKSRSKGGRTVKEIFRSMSQLQSSQEQ